MSITDRARAEAAAVAERLPELATDPAVLVGALGVVLLVAGRRLYKLTVVSPGIAAGVMVGLDLTEGQSTGVRIATSAGLAIIAAFVLHSVERLAVAAAGAFVSVGVARAVAPHFMGGEAPWYILVAAGIVGLLLFPRLYEKLLLVITPAIGALCLAWAIGRPQDLLLVVGLTLGGVVIQLLLGRKSGD